AGAVAIARRFPETEVVGVDLSDDMLGEARRLQPDELRGRVTFQPADASALPFADGSFELVAHANMIPFFDEVTRVLAPGGYALWPLRPTTAQNADPQTRRRTPRIRRRGRCEALHPGIRRSLHA